MITLDLDHFDRETEVSITASKSKMIKKNVEKIVDVVRGFRGTGDYEFAPTVRACITIAKAAKTSKASISARDEVFRQICMDILTSETSRVGVRKDQSKSKKLIADLIEKHCGSNGIFVEVKPSRKKMAVTEVA